MHLYEKRGAFSYKKLALSVFCFVVILALVMMGIHKMSDRADTGQKEYLAQAIRSAAVEAYATEGRYPESLDEIVEKYGIVIDGSKYVVTYEVFASNIMPEIRVIERGSGAVEEK